MIFQSHKYQGVENEMFRHLKDKKKTIFSIFMIIFLELTKNIKPLSSGFEIYLYSPR